MQRSIFFFGIVILPIFLNFLSSFEVTENVHLIQESVEEKIKQFGANKNLRHTMERGRK